MKPLIYSVLPRPPHPTRDGAAIRNFHLLRALTSEFRVRAFALRAPHLDDGAAVYPREIAVEEFSQASRTPRRAAAAVSSHVGGPPYPIRLYRTRERDRAHFRAIGREPPAWVVAHSYHVGPAALATGRGAWIDFHNLDSQIWERTAETASSVWVRGFAATQAPRIRESERTLLERAAGISCVSPLDAAAMRAVAPGTSPVVVANGVDLARYVFRPEPSREKLLFFVGDLSWPPNADAIRWFRAEVWPRVRRSEPEAVTRILGREPPADLRRPGGEGFELLGEGGDTRPHWAQAAIALAPLRAAGGTRLKILEAAAAGVPVVATSIGAEGLNLSTETEIVVRDDPEGFAASIVELLRDPERRRRLAAAARQRVEREYSWEAIGAAFARELVRRAPA